MSYTKSKAQTGLGSVLMIGGTGYTPSTAVSVYEIKSLNLTGRVASTADVTNFQSSQKEFVAVIGDGGEWSLQGARVSSDAGQAAMEASFQALTLNSFTITLPKAPGQTTSGDSYAFLGLITEMSYDVESEKEISISSKIKISGPLTLTQGS